jgi:hypothetical protein
MMTGFYWYRSDIDAFMKAELSEAPEVFSRLNFAVSNRSVEGRFRRMRLLRVRLSTLCVGRESLSAP